MALCRPRARRSGGGGRAPAEFHLDLERIRLSVSEIHYSGHHVIAVWTSTGFGRVCRASSAGVRLPIHPLHARCVRTQFSRESAEPPRETGMISWTSPRRECGTHPRHPACAHFGPCLPATMLSVLSMGSRHSQQWLSRARTRFISSLRRCPLARRGLPTSSPRVDHCLPDVAPLSPVRFSGGWYFPQ